MTNSHIHHHARRSNRLIAGRCLCACIVAGSAMLGGCVRRTITIDSQPSDALVWLNDREIGRTPVSVDFVHYGTYDVVLMKEGYEPLITTGDASAPVWDMPPLDLGAELLPISLRSHIAWEYELQPTDVQQSEPIIERGRALREQLVGANDAAEPAAPADD